MLALRPVPAGLTVSRCCKTCLAADRRQPLIRPRRYHSTTSPPPPPFSPAESAILSAALRQVPEHGFSLAALTEGSKNAGYLEVSTNLLPRGVFDLVNYHLVTQRLALKDAVQFPDSSFDVGARVRALALARLRANESIINRWQEALAVMALPANVLASLGELARLSDEIWFLAGDRSVDSSWYTKRATLSAMYSSSELFMTTDHSQGFIETERFLDRRLEELRTFGSSLGAVGEWTSFSLKAAINVARSKGMKI